MTRHRGHVVPAARRLALIPGQGGQDGPGDPLGEALVLAGKARTPRERLRALEKVRAATKLKLRGISDPDRESLELLDRNIAEAEAAYKAGGDFETQARALSGWREALHRRLDALPAAESVEVPIVVTYPGSKPDDDPATARMLLADYFRGIPSNLRDPSRFSVKRTISLAFGKSTPAGVEVKVYDTRGVLVWANEGGGRT